MEALIVIPCAENCLLPSFPPSHTASQVRATFASSEREAGGGEELSNNPAVVATLALINNQHLNIYPYAINPHSELGGETAWLREDAIGAHVSDALEPSTCRESIAGQYSTICLAFGGRVREEKKGDSLYGDGSPPCIELVNRLNNILHHARWENGSRHRSDCSCPLVTSFTTTAAPVFVSTRQGTTGEIVTVGGDLVGAVLSYRSSSKSFFQLVYAGRHTSIGGSQFRIKRMQGSNIVEVMPVRSLAPNVSPVSVAVSDESNPGPPSPCPRYGNGAVTAADWCRQAIISSTFFEKMALQSALGVGVLVKMSGDDDSGAFKAARESSGVTRCFPAQACLEVTEINHDGSLRVTGKSADQLRPGDLCDFRAIGELAAIQAETDAYKWFGFARLEALIRHIDAGHSETSSKPPSTPFPDIHGCLVASAGARFVPSLEESGCDEIVWKASRHGACAAIGLIDDVQHVSVDNKMMTCPDSIGSTSVYICSEV